MAICDRCGFKKKHNELISEKSTGGGNVMVCSECYDSIPDNPRWSGPQVRDTLPWTRPDSDVDNNVFYVDSTTYPTIPQAPVPEDE